MLEGDKSAIYPVLEWIFINVDRLKERVYLASYLTKIDVPVEEQSPDVVRLMQLVDQKMEQFKAICIKTCLNKNNFFIQAVHSRIVETRADFMRAEDVRQDLKSMGEEREQLIRKIERSKRKVARRSDLNKSLELAAKLRQETEHQQELQLQRQEQLNALVNTTQRMTRLEKTLHEVEREKASSDPDAMMTKLKREMEINNVLYEKVEHDLEVQKKNYEGVKKIMGMRSLSKENIGQLQEKVWYFS